MLTLEEARRRLLARARRTDGEEVALSVALGRVLVDPRLLAPIDVPPFTNSSMDGFAVRSVDTPGTVRLAGEVVAGGPSAHEVLPGSAMRIMTGAPLPSGADAVVPLEDVIEHADLVEVPRAEPGAFVRLVGSDTQAGSEICLRPTIGPAAIAVLASLGLRAVVVRRRPRVAILSTGDELAEPGEPLAPGAIYDANGAALAAAVAEAGGVPVETPRAADDPSAIEEALAAAASDADLVVTSGGVSVGSHDHVRAILEERGSLDFWRIAVQPGKPLAVGEYGGVTVIGLPGNPVSALVTFELVVRPFIREMLGLMLDGRLHVHARPEQAMPKDPERRAFLRVITWRENGDVLARSAGGQGSAQLRPLAEANGLLVVPEGEAEASPHRYYDTIVIGELA